MTYPYADPERFTGLLEHVERHLGPVRAGRPAELGGRNRGFAIAVHAHADGNMVSAVTTGVRFHRVEGLAPPEFVCSALRGQEDEACYFAHLIADRVVRGGQGYDYGDVYVDAEPLIPGSLIQGLWAAPHPYLDEEFDFFHDGRGELALRFITLIPITLAESRLLAESEDELEEIWEASDTNLLDLYRPSAA